MMHAYVLRTIRNPEGKPTNGLTPVSWFPLAADVQQAIRDLIADGSLEIVAVTKPSALHPERLRTITYLREVVHPEPTSEEGS